MSEVICIKTRKPLKKQRLKCSHPYVKSIIENIAKNKDDVRNMVIYLELHDGHKKVLFNPQTGYELAKALAFIEDEIEELFQSD